MDLPAPLRHRPFTRAQATSHGLSRKRLRTLEHRGVVSRILHDVYVSADRADDLGVRVDAVRLVTHDMLVAIDRTAAWLHGIAVFDLAEAAGAPTVECCVLRGEFPPRRRGVTTTTRDLSAEEIELVDGVRVTTPTRTALDLACRLSRFRGLTALDQVMAQFGIGRDELRLELARFGRRRGVVQARALVELADPGSESTGETLARLTIVDAGLPRPTPQVWVHDDRGVPRYRLDLAYEDAKVAVEYDGVDFHDSAGHRRADERRRTWLRARGWTVIVVTRESFTPDARAAWLGRLATALGSA